MDYTEIAVWVPLSYSETVAWHVQDLGGQGVVVSEVPAEGPQPSEYAVRLYRPGTPETSADWLAQLEARLSELKPHFPELRWRLETRLVPSENWENSWKQYWHPQEIGDRLVIKPSWETYEASAEQIVIELDPKQAFGTGTHATTQLCLRALENSVMNYEDPLVFDIGTGSGILAIAAAKLGAIKVLACDTDPVSVIATRENAEINGVADRITVFEGGIETITGEADLLVINILAEVVADLAPQLAERLCPGGEIIASGIIRQRQSLVEEAFSQAGLAVLRVEYQGEWVVLEARKPDNFTIERD